MKKFLLGVAILVGSVDAANATNLVVNGNFSNPNTGSWGAFANGSVAGWTNTSNGDGIEIGAVGTYGASAYNGATQLAELNGSTPDTISQTITGLVVGQTYNVSWGYGERPGSGAAQTNVTFGGQLIATDTTPSDPASFTWVANSYNIVATSASENLVFQAINGIQNAGSLSYGNAITAVSVSPVPEAEEWAMMLVGLGLIGVAAKSKKEGNFKIIGA